jgi:hypothetical protein
MRNFKQLILWALVIPLLISSCQKEKINKIENAESVKLLIESIPTQDGLYVFESLDQFNETKKDLYKNLEEYKLYFTENAPITNSFHNFNEAMEEFEDGEINNQDDLHRFKMKWKDKLSISDQITEKYNFSYKNLLTDENGIVKVGDEYLMFTNTHVYYNSNLDFSDINNLSSVEIEIKENNIYGRGLSASCTHADGRWRVNGKLYSEEIVVGTLNCFEEIEIELEAVTRFQKRVFGVWFDTRADFIDVELDFDFFVFTDDPINPVTIIQGVHLYKSLNGSKVVSVGAKLEQCLFPGLCNTSVETRHRAIDDSPENFTFDKECEIEFNIEDCQ